MPQLTSINWKGLQRFAAEAAIQQGMRFLGAILFGSHARGDAHPNSDYDVAILLRGERRGGHHALLDLADLTYTPLVEDGLDIRPLPIWEAEWKDPDTAPNPALIRAIQRDGIEIPLAT